jgi:excinuclease ABC subunit C
VTVAERGSKRRLRALAARNAALALAQDRLRQERRRSQRVDALSALQDALGLEQLPVRIEGFDVSNIGGEHTVASMVVFEGGAPRKADYRRFRIRGDVRRQRRPQATAPTARGGEASETVGPDDFSSIEEVLSRRVGQLLEQADRSPHDPDRDGSFASVPDLVMIDGGKGQLSAGLRSLGPLVDRGTAVIGLAKRREQVFLPGRPEPLELDPGSEALQLLQRVRDEAHRFAVEHHRKRRGKAMTASLLDELRGVGPVRKRALLEHFGSPERLIAASREELEAVPGIPGKLARDIHRQLNRAG